MCEVCSAQIIMAVLQSYQGFMSKSKSGMHVSEEKMFKVQYQSSYRMLIM